MRYLERPFYADSLCLLPSSFYCSARSAIMPLLSYMDTPGIGEEGEGGGEGGEVEEEGGGDGGEEEGEGGGDGEEGKGGGGDGAKWEIQEEVGYCKLLPSCKVLPLISFTKIFEQEVYSNDTYLTISFATCSPSSKFDTQKRSCSRSRPTKWMPELATIYSCTDNQHLKS